MIINYYLDNNYILKYNKMDTIPRYVIAGVFSGLIIGFTTYLTNHISPYTVGFLATFPVALASMVFVKGEILKEASRSFFLGILSYALFSMLFYTLVAQNGWNKNTAVIVCVLGWFLTIAIMWVISK